MIVNADFWKVGGSAIDSRAVLSVMALDPGGDSGWAWGLIGAWELNDASSANGRWLSDVEEDGVRKSLPFWESMAIGGRFRSGEVQTWPEGGWVDVPSGSLYHSESRHADRIVELTALAGEATSRLTKGRLPRVTHFVCEDFILSEGTMDRSLLSPVRLTSTVFNGLHALSTDMQFYFQSASMGKGTVDDEQLRTMGLWVPSRHARDACRHLITFLRRLKVVVAK